MSKEIYQDSNGLYFVEYDPQGNPNKIYCDESGQKELFQDQTGPYYVGYDIKGLPFKIYCDEEGNRLDLKITVNEEQKVEEKQVVVEPQNEKGLAQNLQDMISNSQSAAAAEQVNNFEVSKEDKFKKLSWIIPVVVLLIGLGYYVFGSSQNKVDMTVYNVTFEASGADGKGIPVAKIANIPNVTDDISDEEKAREIDLFLAKPTIKYSKEDSLKNGDKVEVSLELDQEKVEEYGLVLEGEFKQTFDVSGLSSSKTETAPSNEPNKNWFVVNGHHRADNGAHPDTQLRNGFNSWAAGEGLSLERMKGGSEFGGTILGNKVVLDDKAIDLRFIRYHGENQETVRAGEILKDTYNVVGIFSDKSSVIYVLAIYNGKAHVFKTELDGGKPKTKDGLIVFEDANNSEVKNMLQSVIDRME